MTACVGYSLYLKVPLSLVDLREQRVVQVGRPFPWGNPCLGCKGLFVLVFGWLRTLPDLSFPAYFRWIFFVASFPRIQ